MGGNYINDRYRGRDSRDFRDMPRLNERIRAPQVRVVDYKNNQLGLMTSRQANDLARERNLDLVEVAPNANPPVCRIIDYGKYKYEKSKREGEQKKKQKLAQTYDNESDGRFIAAAEKLARQTYLERAILFVHQ